MIGTWQSKKHYNRPCIVCTEVNGLYEVQPIFAMYDAEEAEWVNVVGEKVDGVVCWMEAPTTPVEFLRAKKAADELMACYDKDTCENPDCAYFCRQDRIKAINDYFTGGNNK